MLEDGFQFDKFIITPYVGRISGMKTKLPSSRLWPPDPDALASGQSINFNMSALSVPVP